MDEWKNCRDELPPDDANIGLMMRSNGVKEWESNGYAINYTAVHHPEWEAKKNALEWKLL